MKRYLISVSLLVALVTPALAAEYAVEDTVNYCTVIDAQPSPTHVSGLRVVGSTQGYDTRVIARQALVASHRCKGGIGDISL